MDFLLNKHLGAKAWIFETLAPNLFTPFMMNFPQIYNFTSSPPLVGPTNCQSEPLIKWNPPMMDPKIS